MKGGSVYFFQHLINCCSNYNITAQKHGPVYRQPRYHGEEASCMETLKFNSKQSADWATPIGRVTYSWHYGGRRLAFCFVVSLEWERSADFGGTRTKKDKRRHLGGKVTDDDDRLSVLFQYSSPLTPRRHTHTHTQARTHTPIAPPQQLAPCLWTPSLARTLWWAKKKKNSQEFVNICFVSNY